MRKYSMRDLREIIGDGLAEDLEKHYDGDAEAYAKYLREIGPLDHIGYLCGIYGVTGCLMSSRTTGKWYAIVGRCSAIFVAV